LVLFLSVIKSLIYLTDNKAISYCIHYFKRLFLFYYKLCFLISTLRKIEYNLISQNKKLFIIIISKTVFYFSKLFLIINNIYTQQQNNHFL